MTRGKQSFLGGAALLTVTMLVTKAIGALYKIPLGNLLDEQGMNYFYAAYNIYNLLLMVSTAGLPLALSRLVSQAEALGWVNRRRRIVSVAFWLFLLLGLLALALYVGGGRLRLFFYPAIALGAALYFRVLSPFVLRALNAALGAVGRVLRLLLWPGQKFLKISRIFFKKFFASVKKWFTIFDKMKSRRNARIPERSSAKHEIRQVIAAGEAGHSDRGGLRRGNAGVAPQSDRGQKRRGRRAHKQHHGR